MSNGARHVLGVVAGLLLPPLIAAGLWYGVGELRLTAAQAFQISWSAIGVLVAAGIGLAFLAGSRLSPVASLLGGLSFTVLGLLPLLATLGVPLLLPENLLPDLLETGYNTIAYTGLQLVLGVVLLMVSLFPSRWRSTAEPAVYSPAYNEAPSPYLPPRSGSEDATRPMYRD
ncbi:hypothetical protein ETD86_41165 [Nonomuraea turkmeniaca]|uniref:Uncharacterized protein n=1 Tax=Nonomuraea turkmeniaca TaxID=103838 RepID=A0A5S4F1S7_9ACTN|nr:hypothetical protein [Nonomuraea turkmeniaca]TMR10029.1 hypothetical protein ETD86_41165 [Nonomuraea turkmeniaca]